MKNQIANIKRNWKEESKKSLFVIAGFISGQAIAKGFDWLAGKVPQLEPVIKYGKPIFLAGGGWLLSSATNDQQMEAKYFGYGLQSAGAFEGIKLIPIAKDFFNGEAMSGLGANYYMESDKPLLELGQFGINALPVKSLEMEAAPEVKLDLPELEGSDEEIQGAEDENINGPNLGYDPERFEGII